MTIFPPTTDTDQAFEPLTVAVMVAALRRPRGTETAPTEHGAFALEVAARLTEQERAAAFVAVLEELLDRIHAERAPRAADDARAGDERPTTNGQVP